MADERASCGVDHSLVAHAEELQATVSRGNNSQPWLSVRTSGEEFSNWLNEGSMSPRSAEQLACAAGVEQAAAQALAAAAADGSEEEAVSSLGATSAATSSFRQRLKDAIPAHGVATRMDWSRLVAVDTTEALMAPTAEEPAAPVLAGRRPPRRAPVSVQINSGGQVFFGLLSQPAGIPAEEAVVIKFCNSRHMLQSEQMAAELAWHFGISAPRSRLLLKVHDQEEWQQLAATAEPFCPELSELMGRKQSMLLLQYIPGADLEKETEAWEMGQLGSSANALGRLLVLDMFLGNADRLPAASSLNWRGNPSNVLWSTASFHAPTPVAATAATGSTRCVPIDAVVARRPPRLLVQDGDHRVACALELALLDRRSAQELLLETVSCNPAAVSAIEADWAPSEPAWVKQFGKGSLGLKQSIVKSFHEGVKAALELAVSEQGLLEMIVAQLEETDRNIRADMNEVAHTSALNGTKQLKQLERVANENEDVRDRLSAWQELLQQKSIILGHAVREWTTRRRVGAVPLSFRGFLGESVLNPVADAYELLVRLRHLVARGKVLASAAGVTRPADLSPSPLLVGPSTSVCLHLLRKLGVTDIINCSEDLPQPDSQALGGLRWHRLALADVEEQDLSKALDEGLKLVDEAKARGGRVLVHCHEGKSRSVSFCLAYFMTREKRPLAEGLAFVKTKRPQARPNAGFMNQLSDLEEAVLGSRSVSAEDMPKGKPKMLVCRICGQAAGLTEDALASHMRRMHPSEGS